MQLYERTWFLFFPDTANTQRGFEGCIYRMQIDNIFPLKRAFQDPRPSFIEPEPEGGINKYIYIHLYNICAKNTDT